MPSLTNSRYEEAVDVKRLVPHPRNANQGDFGAIQQSMQVNGFYGVIIANKRTGHILAGNHRYRVAVQMGYEKLPVVWVDVPPQDELRIMVADNRTTRLGADDSTILAELLSELAQSTDEGLVGTGYDTDDLDALLNEVSNPLQFDEDEFKEVGEDLATNRECPKCGFKWSDGGK
jgi:hypothetical protein